MKKGFIYILSFLFCLSSHAQILTTEPGFVTESGSIKVIFDASQGSKGLMNYNGDVYAHTGVITGSNDSRWEYASTWEANSDKYKMTSLGNNKWELTLSPDIRTYYGVPAGTPIKKLVFVFRSGAKSGNDYLTGKETGEKDIYLSVYESGLNVKLDSPAKDMVVEKGTSLTLTASSSVAADLQLSVNESVVATKNRATSISASYVFSSPGTYTVKATATLDGVVGSATRLVSILEPSVSAPLPDGVRPGINYVSPTEVTLVLQAPGKTSVYAIGDFNAWNPLPDYQLKKDGEYFWITLQGLTPKQEYAFQYLVDGAIRIADPYTDKVLDLWNDGDITATTYPGLMAYPTGKTEGIVSVLQTDQTPYTWKSVGFDKPAKEKLIIYELLLRDFTEEHTFNSAREKISYLKGLGINAVELMPVNEFEGNSSWGYNPSFYFAPDKYYGTKDDMKAFVDECHRNGIAVIMDLVLNHSYGQSPFYLLYRDADGTPSADNPWYNRQSNIANPSLSWGYDFNHDSPYTRALVDSVAAYWMNEYRVDGFRYDFTKGFSNTVYSNVNDYASAYDASRIANLKRMAGEVWKRNPDAYVICEHLADNTEEKELSSAGLMLWGNMNNNACEGAMGFTENSKSDISGAVYKKRTWSAPNLVGYMESHDEERMSYKLKTYGNAAGGYDTKDHATSMNRLKMSGCLFFLIPGPKMIWQFGELGYDYSINYNDRVGEKPVCWNYLEDADRKSVYNTWAQLFAMKAQYPVFSTSDITYKLSDACKYLVLKSPDMNVVIVANYGVTQGNVAVTFPATGTWYNYFSKTTEQITSVNNTITLAPGEYRLYTDKEMTISTSLSEVPESPVSVYPNPVSDVLNVSGEDVSRISVYSLHGVLLKDVRDSNAVSVQELAKGVYLVRIRTGSSEIITKFVKQ